jgi:hypothetical protein
LRVGFGQLWHGSHCLAEFHVLGESALRAADEGGSLALGPVRIGNLSQFINLFFEVTALLPGEVLSNDVFEEFDLSIVHLAP